MSDELVFYTNPMSRGRVARWMLEEVGQPYRTEIIDYGPQMKSPPYTDINPMGKVPALRHGDAVVTETAAICAYLADAFPQAGLAPAPAAASAPPIIAGCFSRPAPPRPRSSTQLSVSSRLLSAAGWRAMARSRMS